MDYLNILAIMTETANEAVAPQSVVPIDDIWNQITSLSTLEALTFISFGVVCLFYGWRVFKILVIISFAMLGLTLGMIAAREISGENDQLTGALIGLVLMAILAVPLMKWAVCVLGAIAGGMLASGIWYACELNEKYILAGALIGIIAGGMISFIIFKIAVMLFSSFAGSMLVVIGTLAVLQSYEQTQQQIHDMVYDEKWFLPVLITLPTLIGLIVQNKFIKRSAEWTV